MSRNSVFKRTHNEVGTCIGNYRIIAPIASGGFGSVYLGQHTILISRLVAIKLLQSKYLLSQKERDRFLHEAHILEQLNHPHIVSLLDVGIHEVLPYIVTDYLPGGSLQDRVDKQFPHPLSIQEALVILSQIGRALSYAHQQNIVHRDLKPANVLFNTDGKALLADFGIATLLTGASTKQTATVLGSLRYMAPEQFHGIISKEGDQYALACLAYQLFTGCAPFDADEPAALMYQHLYTQPIAPMQRNPSLPPSIGEALLKALAKQRMDRFRDITTFLAALQPSTIHTHTQPSAFSPKSKEDWMNEGNTCYKAKRYKAALAAYNHVLRLDPSCAAAYNNKGATLYSLNRYGAALVAYNHALRLDPSYAVALYGKSLTLQSLGRQMEARSVYRKARRLGYA